MIRRIRARFSRLRRLEAENRQLREIVNELTAPNPGSWNKTRRF